MASTKLCDLLRVARITRGWSQLQLAQAAGLTNIRISKIERGYVRPRPDEVARLATALGLDELRPEGR